MATTMSELGIDKWSVDDRLALVEEICESIDSPLTEEVQTELDRRIAELDANPDDVDTWDEIKEFVRRKR